MDHASQPPPANELKAPGSELAQTLAVASQAFDGTGADPERNCWMAVHRHVHGVLPSEYDIREVPEELYLEVLEARRALG
ncbi:MAG: hypothetical protein AAFX65_00335 [Cyanobacteria bacterium J06638_7]